MASNRFLSQDVCDGVVSSTSGQGWERVRAPETYDNESNMRRDAHHHLVTRYCSSASKLQLRVVVGSSELLLNSMATINATGKSTVGVAALRMLWF